MVNIHTQNPFLKDVRASRSAFTMIELIFAIVLISISMLSIPMVLRQDAKNQEDSLMQEGIMLAAAKSVEIASYSWDPSSSVDLTLSKDQMLGTTAGDNELGVRRAVPFGNYSNGQFPQDLRRRMSDVNNTRTATAIGGFVANPTSINDYNGEIQVIPGGTPEFAYKKQWTLSTQISYVSDAATYTTSPTLNDFNFPIVASGGTTNIKMITVTAQDTTPTTLGSANNRVVLRSYAFNIGEPDYYKRRY